MLTTEKPSLIYELAEVLPKDEYNRVLISNVHPPDWENPEPAPCYNLVVVGAGTAGLVSAAGAAGLGAKVALVERNLMGGDCLNVGCVPSKALIRSARAYADALGSRRLGVRVPEEIVVDFAAVMERMRQLRAKISHHDSANRFRELGVDVFLGAGQFTRNKTIGVGGKVRRFKKAVMATGARAVRPPIKGLAEAGYLTNETVFNLTERPQRLLVLGGGPLGCEMAQAFSRLGCEVTVVEMEPRLLIREDPDASIILTNVLQRDGISIKLNTKIRLVLSSGKEKLVHLETKGKTETLAVDEILVAIGRAPNLEGLGLGAAGVKHDESGVAVNDNLQTTNPRIYAAGDVCMQYKFTHAADAAARIVIQNALFLGQKKFSSLKIPWCTYTDPEIAHIGMQESDTHASGIDVDTFVVHMRMVDRAIVDGDEKGFVKIHAKKGSDKILGATIVARHAGEMISEISLAMFRNIGLGSMASVIHPYPTQADAIRKAGDEYNRTRLTPFIKKLLKGWLSWTR